MIQEDKKLLLKSKSVTPTQNLSLVRVSIDLCNLVLVQLLLRYPNLLPCLVRISCKIPPFPRTYTQTCIFHLKDATANNYRSILYSNFY